MTSPKTKRRKGHRMSDEERLRRCRIAQKRWRDNYPERKKASNDRWKKKNPTYNRDYLRAHPEMVKPPTAAQQKISYHKNKARRKMIRDSKPPKRCEICDRNFVSEKTLETHIVTAKIHKKNLEKLKAIEEAKLEPQPEEEISSESDSSESDSSSSSESSSSESSSSESSSSENESEA